MKCCVSEWNHRFQAYSPILHCWSYYRGMGISLPLLIWKPLVFILCLWMKSKPDSRCQWLWGIWTGTRACCLPRAPQSPAFWKSQKQKMDFLHTGLCKTALPSFRAHKQTGWESEDCSASEEKASGTPWSSFSTWSGYRRAGEGLSKAGGDRIEGITWMESGLDKASLLSLEKTEGRHHWGLNILMRGSRGAGAGLFTLMATDRTWGNGWSCRGGLGWRSGEGFSSRGWLGTGTAPQGSAHSPAWQSSRSVCTMLSGTGVALSVPCAVPGDGLDDPCGSLPVQHILSFYDKMVKTGRSCERGNVGEF